MRTRADVGILAETCSGSRSSSSSPASTSRLMKPDTSSSASMAENTRNRRLLPERNAPAPVSATREDKKKPAARDAVSKRFRRTT